MLATPPTVRVQRGVLIQDLDTVPQVNHFRVIPQSDSGAGRPWEPWKRELSFVSVLEEDGPI